MIALSRKFRDYYSATRRHIGSTDDLLTLQAKKFKYQLSNWELTPEEQGKYLTEYYIKETEMLMTNSVSITMQLIELEYKAELLNQQANQVIRQIQGYDDNLMSKIAEFQSGLASFAVNAGSDTAQDTINDLKTIMIDIEKRVTVLVNNENPSLTLPTP